MYSYDNRVLLGVYVCVAIGGLGGGSALKGRAELFEYEFSPEGAR